MGTDPAKARETEKKEHRAAETWKARAAGAGKKAAGFFSELGRRAVRLAGRSGQWLSGVFVFWKELLGRPFRRFSSFWRQRREERLYLSDRNIEMENVEKKRGNARVSFRKDCLFPLDAGWQIWQKRCFNSLIRLTAWTARLFWNRGLDFPGRLSGLYRTYVFIPVLDF